MSSCGACCDSIFYNVLGLQLRATCSSSGGLGLRTYLEDVSGLICGRLVDREIGLGSSMYQFSYVLVNGLLIGRIGGLVLRTF